MRVNEIRELERAISEVKNELESNVHVQTYKTFSNQISNDAKLNHMWSEKTRIQKELIQAKQYQLIEQQAYLTKQLNEINNEFKDSPLMIAYNELYEQIVCIQKEIEEIVFSEK